MVRRTSTLEMKRSRNSVRSTRPSSRNAVQAAAAVVCAKLSQQHRWHDHARLDRQHDLNHVARGSRPNAFQRILRLEVISDRLPGEVNPLSEYAQGDRLRLQEKLQVPVVVARPRRRDHLANGSSFKVARSTSRCAATGCLAGSATTIGSCRRRRCEGPDLRDSPVEESGFELLAPPGEGLALRDHRNRPPALLVREKK
jgi:hypothetical protein